MDKTKKILTFVILGVALVLAISFNVDFSQFKKDDYVKPSCDSYGVIFLKESEEHLMSNMSKVAGISSVPAENKVIAQVDDVMSCDSFNYKNYVKTGEENIQQELKEYLQEGDYNLLS